MLGSCSFITAFYMLAQYFYKPGNDLFKISVKSIDISANQQTYCPKKQREK